MKCYPLEKIMLFKKLIIRNVLEKFEKYSMLIISYIYLKESGKKLLFYNCHKL